MQEIREEEVRLWSARVITNAPISEGELREALGSLKEGERPYMWLHVHVKDHEGTRILLTNWRLIIFRRISKPSALQQMVVEASYDLEALSAPPIQRIADYTALVMSFGTGDAQSVVIITGIPAAIAEEARRFLTLSANERTAATVLRRPTSHVASSEKGKSFLLTTIVLLFSAAASFAWLTFIPGLLLRLLLIGIMVTAVWGGFKELLSTRLSPEPHDSSETFVLLWIILVYSAFLIAASLSPKIPLGRSYQTANAERIIEQRDKDLTVLLNTVPPAERQVFAWLGGVRLADVESRPGAEVSRTTMSIGRLHRLKARLWALSGVRLMLALLAISMVIQLFLRFHQRTTMVTNKGALDSWTVQDGIFLWTLGLSSLLIITFYIPLAIELIRSVRTGRVEMLSLPDIVYILGWLPTGLSILLVRRNGKLFGVRPNAGLWSGVFVLLGIASLAYWFDRLGILSLNAAMNWVGLKPGGEALRQAGPLISGSYFAVGINVFVTVIVAPFFEEVCYRGWLYGGLRRIIKPAWAIPISAVVFSFFHGFSLYGSIQVFWSGVIYAYLYEKTHRLWPGILAHATWNALATLTVLLLYRGP